VFEHSRFDHDKVIAEAEVNEIKVLKERRREINLKLKWNGEYKPQSTNLPTLVMKWEKKN